MPSLTGDRGGIGPLEGPTAYYNVLHTILICNNLNYTSSSLCYKALLRILKKYLTSPYYKVPLRTTKYPSVLQSTTRYYKILLRRYYKVLLGTIRYYSVLSFYGLSCPLWFMHFFIYSIIYLLFYLYVYIYILI